MLHAKEILINAFSVSFKKHIKHNHQFEFIINEKLKMLQCIQLFTATSNHNPFIIPIDDPRKIHDVLFELNHVRVNPKLNNSSIISVLMNAFADIGVMVDNKPQQDSMAICFQPLGDIKDNVRFYIKENNQMIFLANTAKPKLVYQNRL
jgi:hypothetical protein